MRRITFSSCTGPRVTEARYYNKNPANSFRQGRVSHCGVSIHSQPRPPRPPPTSTGPPFGVSDFVKVGVLNERRGHGLSVHSSQTWHSALLRVQRGQELLDRPRDMGMVFRMWHTAFLR